MIRIFRKKITDSKRTARIFVFLMLMCLFGGNAWGQTITKKTDNSIIVTNTTSLPLIICKTGTLSDSEKKVISSATCGDNICMRPISIAITGARYKTPSANFIIIKGRRTSAEITFDAANIPDNLYFYKVNPANDSFESAGSKPLKELFKKEEKPDVNAAKLEQERIAAEIAKADAAAKAEQKRKAEERARIAAAAKAEEALQEQQPQVLQPQEQPAQSQNISTPETNTIDYGAKIARLEKRAKAFNYILQLKDDELDAKTKAKLSKEDVKVRKLIKETGSVRIQINKEKDFKAEKIRLDTLNNRLRTIKDAIAYLLVDLKPYIKDKLIDDFRENFKQITNNQFDEVRDFIDENRYKDNWYNWWGKGKYENMLDDLAKNESIYLANSQRFIDSIGSIQKYGEKGKKLLENQLENVKRRFENIEHSRQILKTDFAVPVLKLVIVILLLVLIIAVIIILLIINTRNQNIKRKKEEETKRKDEQLGKSTFKTIDASTMLDNTENTTGDSTVPPAATKLKFRQLKKYEHGLDAVKSNVGTMYKEIDMFDFVDSSSIHKVYLSREIIKDLFKFFHEFSTSAETGCYVIGRWDYAPNSDRQAYDISLEYTVKPGRDATYSKYECNFGAEIGTSLIMDNRKYSEQENTEYVQTSWVHSHPGLQLFLSSQDLIVQSTLTNNSPYKRMLAIVIDTIDDFKMAFFTPKSGDDNVMNNAEDMKQNITLDELYHWAESEYNEPDEDEEND